jgi:hypothetical protein
MTIEESTTLEDLFTMTPKPNGNTIWEPKPVDKVTVVGSAISAITPKEISDKEFYKKMFVIDPIAAKQFMDSRLKVLKESVIKIREEIKQLEEYMEPTEDKIVSKYYKKVKNSDEPGSLKSHIVNYFKDNLKKDVKADHILESFKSKGLKLWNKTSIVQSLYGMVRMKEITNPYRGYFRMEA